MRRGWSLLTTRSALAVVAPARKGASVGFVDGIEFARWSVLEPLSPEEAVHVASVCVERGFRHEPLLYRCGWAVLSCAFDAGPSLTVKMAYILMSQRLVRNLPMVAAVLGRLTELAPRMSAGEVCYAVSAVKAVGRRHFSLHEARLAASNVRRLDENVVEISDPRLDDIIDDNAECGNLIDFTLDALESSLLDNQAQTTTVAELLLLVEGFASVGCGRFEEVCIAITDRIASIQSITCRDAAKLLEAGRKLHQRVVDPLNLSLYNDLRREHQYLLPLLHRTVALVTQHERPLAQLARDDPQTIISLRGFCEWYATMVGEDEPTMAMLWERLRMLRISSVALAQRQRPLPPSQARRWARQETKSVAPWNRPTTTPTATPPQFRAPSFIGRRSRESRGRPGLKPFGRRRIKAGYAKRLCDKYLGKA